MEAGAIIVMILALLALIGVVVFLVYDYLKHKDANAKDFKDTDVRIDTEKKDRLSNLKFVVDQVNDVNNDIYDTMMSNVGRLDTSFSNVSGIQSGMLGGLGTFLQFSSNSIDGRSHNVDLLNLPGTVNPNVQLMQHVNVMMGLTVKDLDGASSNIVEFCSKADPTRCVKIPDRDGNVVLKSLTPSGKVMVDSPMRLSGSLSLTGSNATTAASQVSLSSDGTSLFLQGQGVAVGNFSNPGAKLHVQADQGAAAFKVSLPTSDALLVSADGSLVTTQPIIMKRNLADVNSVATLSIDIDGTNNTDFLKVQTNRLHVQGDFSVSGTAKVAGQTVAVVPPSTPA